MKADWRYAAAAALVVVGGVGGWLLVSTGDPDDSVDADGVVTPVITDVGIDPSLARSYQFSRWWSDGESALRLGVDGADVVVRTPDRSIAPGAVSARLAGADALDPAAVAAMPGGSGAPWVAVSTRDPDDDSGVIRSWTGGDGEAQRAVRPTRVPAELRPVSSDDVITNDVAVARSGETTSALVVVHQGSTSQLFACRLDDCEWTSVEAPNQQAVGYVASTGSGFVAVTDAGSDRAQVWYAEAGTSTWSRVGEAPEDMRLRAAQDGLDEVLLIWADGEGGRAMVQKVAPDAGDQAVTTVAGPASIGPDSSRLTSVLQVGDDWLLAGSAASESGVSLAYPASAPRLWSLDGDRWRDVEAAVLDQQPDQEFQVLWHSGDAIVGVSASAPLKVHEIWRLVPAS